MKKYCRHLTSEPGWLLWSLWCDNCICVLCIVDNTAHYLTLLVIWGFWSLLCPDSSLSSNESGARKRQLIVFDGGPTKTGAIKLKKPEVAPGAGSIDRLKPPPSGNFANPIRKLSSPSANHCSPNITSSPSPTLTSPSGKETAKSQPSPTVKLKRLATSEGDSDSSVRTWIGILPPIGTVFISLVIIFFPTKYDFPVVTDWYGCSRPPDLILCYGVASLSRCDSSRPIGGAEVSRSEKEDPAHNVAMSLRSCSRGRRSGHRVGGSPGLLAVWRSDSGLSALLPSAHHHNVQVPLESRRSAVSSRKWSTYYAKSYWPPNYLFHFMISGVTFVYIFFLTY